MLRIFGAPKIPMEFFRASQHLLRWKGSPAQDCIAGSFHVFAPRRSMRKNYFDNIMPRRQYDVAEGNGLKF